MKVHWIIIIWILTNNFSLLIQWFTFQSIIHHRRLPQWWPGAENGVAVHDLSALWRSARCSHGQGMSVHEQFNHILMQHWTKHLINFLLVFREWHLARNMHKLKVLHLQSSRLMIILWRHCLQKLPWRVWLPWRSYCRRSMAGAKTICFHFWWAAQSWLMCWRGEFTEDVRASGHVCGWRLNISVVSGLRCLVRVWILQGLWVLLCWPTTGLTTGSTGWVPSPVDSLLLH